MSNQTTANTYIVYGWLVYTLWDLFLSGATITP